MKFEDLIAWQKARELTNGVYQLGVVGPLAKNFGLRDQLQRASVSVMSNLAEGFERVHRAEKSQLWNVAKASAGEVKSLLYVVGDNGLAETATVKQLQDLCTEVSKLCHGLMASYARPKTES